MLTDENETKKTYIPPSERQAEQELRKYMGSSIPSRSFKMLQAMTAAQDISGQYCKKLFSFISNLKYIYFLHVTYFNKLIARTIESDRNLAREVAFCSHLM